MKKINYFTFLPKNSIYTNANLKYQSSVHTPKNSTKKLTNYFFGNKEEEYEIIKKKFLNKTKISESTSSFTIIKSPLNKLYMEQSKVKSPLRKQLILSINSSSLIKSKEKNLSYFNNYGNIYYNNNLKSRASNLFHKCLTKTNSNLNENIIHFVNTNNYNKSFKKKSIYTTYTTRTNSFENKRKIIINKINYNNNNNDYCLNHTRQTKYSSLNYYIANSKFNIKYLSCYIKKKRIKNKNSSMTKNNNFIKFNNCDLITKKNSKKFSYSNKHTPSNSLLKLNTVTKLNKLLNNFNFQKDRSNSCDVKPKKKLIKLQSKNSNKIKNKINNNSYCSNTKKKNSQSQKNILLKTNIKNHTNNNNNLIKYPLSESNYKKHYENSNWEERKKKLQKNLEIEFIKNLIKTENKKEINNTKYQNRNNIISNNKTNKTQKIISRKKIEENKEEIQITSISKKSNSTLSSSNRDCHYYLKLSLKLSQYIKSYYLKYKKFPETSLSFYKYGRLIGQGAFGKVNIGLNVLTGKIVAIKSFNKSNLKINNFENQNKILYETNLMKELNHKNITKILELFESDNYILIIMEYINGGNLFSFVKKRRKLSEKTAKFLFKQIIEGIEYIHSKNIVHRDIKLENILIDLKNNIKICDFGIGKILNNKNEKLYDQSGTLMYMAPEILLNKKKGFEAFPIDLWSCGICLYIMLSGTIPFSINNNNNNNNYNNNNNNYNNDSNNNERDSRILQYNIINNEPKSINNISIEAIDLIMGLLNKDPKKRYNIYQVLNHPWLKNENMFNYKYHLFTKAEMIMLNKTFIDYRFAKIEDIKENFSISNLKDDNIKKEISNCLTKSLILAPYNTNFNYKNNYSYEEDKIPFYEFYQKENLEKTEKKNEKEIKIENGIILFGNKIKEFNISYELNNNCELDNGIIINTKSDNNSSFSNNFLSNEPSGYYFDDEDSIILKNKIKNIEFSTFGRIEDENVKFENILKKIEDFGYNKDYVRNCIKNNILCHATAVYFLLSNYEYI